MTFPSLSLCRGCRPTGKNRIKKGNLSESSDEVLEGEGKMNALHNKVLNSKQQKQLLANLQESKSPGQLTELCGRPQGRFTGDL